MEKLRPCPFCGGDSVMHSCSLNYLYEYEGAIECQRCRTYFKIVGQGEANTLQKAREKITEKWNTRAGDPIVLEPIRVQLTEEQIQDLIETPKKIRAWLCGGAEHGEP